jgi:hypothetical protein
MLRSPACPRFSGRPALVLAALALSALAVPPLQAGASPVRLATVAPQVADTLLPPPADTWSDPGVRDLLIRARAARADQAEGLESYQGRVWERIYAGLDARGFRRERGLFTEERTGYLRWSADGERWVRWEGARRDLPIVGLSSAQHEEQARDLAAQLATGSLPMGMAIEPGRDRIVFGEGNWALDPLADSAGHHYRYHSGDTLRIRMTEPDRELRLVEVKVEPRRNEFRLVAASLWFDEATGALARAVYRPARPFDLSLDGGDDDDDVPRFLRPIRAEIRVVSVDHGFFDFQWWIPRRFLFEGEATVGRLARFPLRIEWALSELDVNQELPALLDGTDLPPGWTVQTGPEPRRGDEGDSVRVTRIVPPASTLADHPDIGPSPRAEAATFTPAELAVLEGELEALMPGGGMGAVRFSWGMEDGLTRFNRVEGFATGVGVELPVPGGRSVSGRVRVGTHALVPTGEVALRRAAPGGVTSLALYHRLEGASEWQAPAGLGASLGNLVNGEGPTPWYRAIGASLGREGARARSRFSGELFVEAHRTATTGTRFHLRRLFDAERSVPQNLEADEETWLGLRGEHRWQSGTDPLAPRAFSRLRAEGGAGASEWGRGSLSVGVVVPLLPGWDAAVEVGGGGSLGELPVQRRFFPGGASGYRPARVGEREGEGYALGRIELGRGMPGARVVAFVDALATWRRDGSTPSLPWIVPGPVGWAGTTLGGGVGLSALDGLVRLDLVREFEAGEGWRALLYFDGLF